MAPMIGTTGQLTRDERVQLYGIDCEDQVCWFEWTPGVETVQDLALQNVALVTQKVKFKLPPSKEFDMPYPEPFKLAPGMKKSIPISFRPAKYEPHVDKVQIITKGGSFFVTVKAIVKDIALTVPHFVDFGLCPTRERSEQHIDVYNTGTLKACVRWHAKPPFTVKSPKTTIEVGGSFRCVVEFEPRTASVFNGLVVCEASSPPDPSGEEAHRETKQYFVQATGVGKMPHLCVPGSVTPVVDFGSVFPGSRVPQTLQILNTTPVRATFKVRALHEGEIMPLPPAPFSVSPESGVVEPNNPFTLTFYFQSHTIKEFTCQRFQITNAGGTPMIVTCKAFCRPMEVRLSTRSISFGAVPAGKVYTRTLQLHNDSDRPASYHFINAEHLRGVFWFDRHQGVVPPDSFMVVTVYFGPLAAINYYKQVYCAVKGALAPLMLHLIGTAHTEKSRPARLDQHHVDVFRSLQLSGVREHPPAPEGQSPQDDEEEDEGPAEEDKAAAEAAAKPLSATAAYLEMMLPMDSKLRDITVLPVDLDFGSCSTMTMSDKHTVVITNRTSQRVYVAWMIPGETRMPCTADEKALFSVNPVQCDIKPRGQAEFRVAFRPHFENNYEGEILEAVICHKANRSFRLVDLKRFTPPWTVAIRGMGHTMGSTRNDPRLDIAESHIRFRACYPGERTYQFAMFCNPGDTCISYLILPPIDVGHAPPAYSTAKGTDHYSREAPFKAWPSQGIIAPHQFHLVVLEFAPTHARNEHAFVANFQVVVDYNETHPTTLRVAGRAWEPQLSFCRGQPTMMFPPTCSGIVSSMSCEIKNISEIPVSYECKIPSRFRSLFWFSNPNGQLSPSESSSITAYFCPTDEKVFSAPLYCSAKSVEDPDSFVKGPLKPPAPPASGIDAADVPASYILQFVGHGRAPAITLEPDRLDLGAVKACDEVMNCVTILNSSNLTVHYTVEFEFVGQSEEPAPAVGRQALKLGSSEGGVAGRCTDTLDITFHPPCRGLYEYHIIVTPKGGNTSDQLRNATHKSPTGGRRSNSVIFALRADVQYPRIQIVDLRTECATLQPQSMMWTQFQVDGINELYREEVAEVERRFQQAIGIDEKKQLVRQLKPFQLLFGTSAAGSPPTVVYLVFSNPNKLSIRFSFQLPKDLNLENAPYWCDEKALVDDREAHFSWVEDHGIYDIQPRSGEIPPGDFLHVKMTYHHHSIGTHILPVVFNVHDGRSVLFYLKALSVAPNTGCLSVRSSVVTLQPVPLNVDMGPTQPVELTNSGCVPAPWRVDVQSIHEHNMESYNFEVLSVTPVEGVLDPQSSTFIHFRFTPLEAKQYSCPIRIEMLKEGRPAEELCFRLQAEGYNIGAEKPQVETLFPSNLPIQTYAPVPGCGAALSIEVLDFGTCPLRAAASRMLVLANYNQEFVLTYSWEPRQLFQSYTELQIEPNAGELAPGSHCLVVFRLCCTEPADISGEVACALSWTHLSAYGQQRGIPEAREEEINSRHEFLAYHCDHIHQPMRTGKAFLAGTNQQHVSVANRLTVTRFRNLMSTAAGQKFLNENLHKTAVLASDIPVTSARRTIQAGTQSLGRSTSVLGASGGMSVGDQLFGPEFPGAHLPAPPSAHPLYVRLRAVVADWEVPKEQRNDFLVYGEHAPKAEFGQDADADYAELLKSRQSSRAGTAAQTPVARTPPEGPNVVGGALEHIVREILAEEGFENILDNMLAQDTPYFVQFEDSPPPGEPGPHFEPIDVADVSACASPSGDAALEGVSNALMELLGSSRSEREFRSDLLLDFPAPPARGPGSGARRPSPAGATPAAKPVPVRADEDSNDPNAGDTHAQAAEFDDNPHRYWADSLREYGEVDLEAFKNSAGEVLDQLLLDMMDDVVAGRLNWMRPMPRVRGARSRSSLPGPR